jgi:dTMP kinase
MSQNGYIIYFDGPDGVGKTVQLNMAAELLKSQGKQVYATRTLGGTTIGEMLREVILSGHDRPVETDFHIALASYHALLGEVTERRERGEIVLIDRSPFSIIGYQVYGDGLDQTAGYQAVGELLDLFQPDMIITYTAEPQTLNERRTQREHAERHNYFEDKPATYHQQVAEGFAYAASHFGGKVIDANGSIKDMHAATMQMIFTLIET